MPFLLIFVVFVFVLVTRGGESEPEDESQPLEGDRLKAAREFYMDNGWWPDSDEVDHRMRK